MGQVEEVAGRFATRVLGGVPTRLMLAKNPAGWSELLDLVAGDDGPLVVSINARIADGADPSWLWDVPFERLAGRPVVATGDRCADLSVRLHYADVDPPGRARSADGRAHGRATARRRRSPATSPPSTSSATTPPSASCSGPGRDGTAAHRRRLPRPARHLR